MASKKTVDQTPGGEDYLCEVYLLQIITLSADNTIMFNRMT